MWLSNCDWMHIQIGTKGFSHVSVVMKNFEFASLWGLIYPLFLTGRMFFAALGYSQSAAHVIEVSNEMYQIYTVPFSEPQELKDIISSDFCSASYDTKLRQGGPEKEISPCLQVGGF